VIEQAALTEAVARTEMHHGIAVSMHHDAAIHDGVEGMRRSPLNNGKPATITITDTRLPLPQP
jgi:hypothetical protein